MWVHYKSIPLKVYLGKPTYVSLLDLNSSAPRGWRATFYSHLCRSAPETIPPMPMNKIYLFYIKVGRMEEGSVWAQNSAIPTRGNLFLMYGIGRLLA